MAVDNEPLTVTDVFPYVATAYYEQLLSGADRATSRARAAQGIAAVIVGLLLASQLEDAARLGPLATLAAVGAILFWTATAVALLWIVASPPPVYSPEEVSSRDQLVREVVARTRRDQEAQRWLQHVSAWAGSVALILTLSTVLLMLFEDDERTRVSLDLSPSLKSFVGSTCMVDVSDLEFFVDKPHSISGAFMTVTVEGCESYSSFNFPSSEVRGVAFDA